MFLIDARAEATESERQEPARSSVAVAGEAAFKAFLAAVSAMVLTSGLGLLVWAITPSSGASPVPLLRAGIAAFGAANGMAVQVGRASLTLSPLIVTLVAVALLTTVNGRGQSKVHGRRQEVVCASAAAFGYAATVTVAGVLLAGHGVIQAGQWWRPALLALLVVGVTTVLRGNGWRPFLVDRCPDWVPVSLRLGGVGVAAVLGGGALTLVLGLVRSMGDVTAVQNLAAPGTGGGFGMTLLGLAYLPNAVIAGAGFATGAGFTIGSGTYSMFGSTPVELPPITLLSAAPNGTDLARPALLLLTFPVLAGLLIGRTAVRRLDAGPDRLRAVGGAALLAAVLLAGLALAASGGVTTGEWSSSGAPPLLFAVAAALELGAVGAAVVAMTRFGRSARLVAGEPAVDPSAVAGGANDQLAADGPTAVDPTTDGDEPAQVDEIAEENEQSADRPEPDVPVADADKPAETEPAETEPAEGKAAETEPAEGKAAEAEPDKSAAPDGEPSSPLPAPRREEERIDAAGPDTDTELVAGLQPRVRPQKAG